MYILAIDTSCDETAAAVTYKDRVISNVTYSQIALHKDWGGVVPDIAMRAHQERIDEVVAKALSNSRITIETIDAIAVTFGPGLAIALGVGIDKAKELAQLHNKPLIPVNHMEGHTYSAFIRNSKGNPQKDIRFPLLALLVSGNHTELVMMKKHNDYEVVGETRDDAAGEALDKAARIILNEQIYPGGPVLEALATKGTKDYFELPIPMVQSKDLDFSYSGIKTALLYKVQSMTDADRISHIHDLAASFQYTVFESIRRKLEKAIEEYKPVSLVLGGGVAANDLLRKIVRTSARSHNVPVFFPFSKKFYGDNAVMIGVAAYFAASQGRLFPSDYPLERKARAYLEDGITVQG